MERVTEPELMDERAQAIAYAEADFDEPNTLFMTLFEERFPQFADGAVLDLGCGPADITMRFARRYPGCEVHGVDGAAEMLAPGLARLAQDPVLARRVRLIEGLVPGVALPREHYAAIISNSLLHHLHDPTGLWTTLRARAAPGAAVLVMDLRRPPSPAEAERLVQEHAGDEPEVLRTDFYNSLRAAFEPGEVRAQLRAAGLDLHVDTVSDRHLAVWGHAP